MELEGVGTWNVQDPFYIIYHVLTTAVTGLQPPADSYPRGQEGAAILLGAHTFIWLLPRKE